MRPFEFLARDPWWIFTTWRLIHTIGTAYGFTLRELIKINARFGVMLGCMFLSIIFILADVIITFKSLMKDAGINPYWRMALVFKCAADCFFLDDFKTVLDQIAQQSLSRVAHGTNNSRTHGRTRSDTIVAPPDTVTATAEAPTKPISSRWKWARRLSSSSCRGNVITVQREMTIISEPKRPHSFSSDVPLVQPPVKSHTDRIGEPQSIPPQPPQLRVPRHKYEPIFIGRASSNQTDGE